MKKKKYLHWIVLIIPAILLICFINVNANNNLQHKEDYAISWADEGFEAFIREYLQKPSGTIYASELEGIEYICLDKEFSHMPHIQVGYKTNEYDNHGMVKYSHQSLNAKNIWKIKTLDDLRHFKNLARLDLACFAVGDMDYFKDMTQLEQLFMMDCENIEDGRFTDISNIANLKNLIEISLTNNYIKDLSPLSELQNLRKAYVGYEETIDYSPLNSWTNIEYLTVQEYDLIDVSFLFDLVNLKELEVQANYWDVSFLKNMDKLEYLRVNCKEIKNFDSISICKGLKKFYMWADDMPDLNCLKDLPELHWLVLYCGNNGKDDEISERLNLSIKIISEIQNLKLLSLHLERGLDYTPISKLTGLTELTINHADISDIDFLIPLKNLTHLNLAWNAISDISALKNLDNLESLNLDANYGVVDISVLKNLKHLKRLNMLNNSIIDWKPVSHVEKIEAVGRNEIDIIPITTGNFGFSYVGLIYMLILLIPNIIWARNKPKGYNSSGENKILLVFERVGQMLSAVSILLFTNYNPEIFELWTAWLIISAILMILYIIYWIRYFRSKQTANDFYRSIFCIPAPGATLPVAAFLLLGIYSKVIWLIVSSIILGIGHIGIHLQHIKDLEMKINNNKFK